MWLIHAINITSWLIVPPNLLGLLINTTPLLPSGLFWPTSPRYMLDIILCDIESSLFPVGHMGS